MFREQRSANRFTNIREMRWLQREWSSDSAVSGLSGRMDGAAAPMKRSWIISSPPEGKTAYMATHIVLSKIHSGDIGRGQEFIRWEPAAALMAAVEREEDWSAEGISLQPELPSVYYENGRQRTEELHLQADSGTGSAWFWMAAWRRLKTDRSTRVQ